MQHHDQTAQASAGSVALLVLGMHRSGTSAVTGMLDRLGIPAAGELLPAEAYNEKGIYENRAVNLFHNRLLDHLGSKWDDPIPVSNAFVETLAGERFVAELAGIVAGELLATAPVFAVKDPRMCRFIPLWKAVLARLGAEPRAIVPLRHPAEVAASLKSRDGFPRAKSFLLWLVHTLAAERETRGMARSFLGYDALLADWRGAADKLARDLRLDWPTERGRIENEIDGFLTRDLRHHDRPAAIGAATRLDALVARAWDALNRLVADETDGEARTALDAVHAEVEAAGAVAGPYVAWEFRALAEARERIAWLEEVERALRAESADYFRQIGEVNAAAETERRRLEAGHRRTLASELGLLRSQNAQEAAKLRAEVSALRPDAARAGWLEGEAARWMNAFHAEEAAHRAVLGSTFWRLSAPVRRIAGTLPPSTRGLLRRGAKAGWWAVTPWRMPARLRFLREREMAALGAPEGGPVPGGEAAPVPASAARRGSSLQSPLSLFAVPGGPPRLSMVTDSINAGSLFGGVATALIFSALLAERTGRRLRIVTRTQAPDAGNVATVFRAHGIDWTGNIEFAFADTGDEKNQIDANPDELFVTTSWWTTEATRASVPKDRILYILQEDERMFYPFGDDNLACAEVLADASIRKVVNSELLHRHLRNDGIVGDETPFFEPSFPDRIYFPAPGAADEKRNFFFYARPNNARNLFARGVAVIEAAIEEGILDPQAWNIHFVGKDLQPMRLAGGVEPILLQNMPWEDYAAYVRSVDLALTLMYTPHPSYPPLDVAACGGVAVTNRFGVKTDLSGYSRSIVCADSDVPSLVAGLRSGVERALDRDGRADALAHSRLKRNWADSFEPVFERLVEGGRLVR